jgi:hypothetical protein
MKVQLLIEAIVQQTTVLIAKLATAGGVRAPLAHVANQVFIDLGSELERQGLSRKVSADMFGISLRAYQRRMQRLRESSTERGRSLWEAVLGYLQSTELASRRDVLRRFARDDEDSVRSILHDLVESGLVFSSGVGAEAVFRAASEHELGAIQRLDHDAGLDELLWSIVFSQGPLTRERLIELCGGRGEEVEPIVLRLLDEGKLEKRLEPEGEVLCAERFFLPEAAEAGWEGAVYDHYRAVVRTLCNRLDVESREAAYRDSIGGSTYTFDVGPGHPLEREVLALLTRLREQCAALRARVANHNATHGRSQCGENVVVYVGQSVVPREELPHAREGEEGKSE